MKAKSNKFKVRGYSCSLWITIFALLLSSCTLISSFTKQSVEPETPLAFDELVYDFGIAGQEEKISYTFRFTNVSSKPVKISRVKTSCGCTAALLSSTDIPPQGIGEIRATFKTGQFIGRQEKTITVLYNDPEEQEIKLTIQGMIKSEVAIDPQGVNLGDVKKGIKAKGQVRLLQLSQHPLFLERIEANEKYMTVTTSRFKEENSRGISIEITLKSEIPVGQFSEVITLHTNLKKRPRIDVPVWANIY